MNIHDISGAEEQYDDMNLQTKWDLENKALSGGITNDDVEFYIKEPITVPEIRTRETARKEKAANFSSELETA